MPADPHSEFERRFPDLASQLGPEGLKRLLDGCSVAEIPPARRLFRDRMPVDSIYLVLDGTMTVSIGEGREKIVLQYAERYGIGANPYDREQADAARDQREQIDVVRPEWWAAYTKPWVP